MFDCRVWNVPNLVEAANTILRREQDATRNSIQMSARSVFSHKQCFMKDTSQLQEMLFQKGINWNDYPSCFKRGTFIQRRKTTKAFTSDELDKLPAKHRARTNPELVVERSEIRTVEMPAFGKVVNRVEVIFEGADPVVELLKKSGVVETIEA